MTKKKRIFLGCTFCFVFVIIISVFYNPEYRIILNSTDSLPRGFYLQVPLDIDRIKPGSVVNFSLNKNIQVLLKDRNWFPQNIPLMKWIYALPGDEVHYVDKDVYINGRLFGKRLEKDGEGKKVPWLHEGLIVLQEGQYFVGSSRLDSFDSRYFGPISKDRITGICYPIWTK